MQDIPSARMVALAQALKRQRLGDEQVARVCQVLTAALEGCRARSFDGPYPYVYLDGRVIATRAHGETVPMAVVLAVRVDDGEQWQVLGYDVGPSGARAFWLGFLRRLAACGVSALPLVAADGRDEIGETLTALLEGRQIPHVEPGGECL